MEENEIVQEEESGKKGKFTPLLLIPVAIIVVAAVIVVFFILPRLRGDGEEEPPEDEPVVYDLPTEFTVGEVTVSAMELAHPAGVDANKALTVTYTYTGLTDTSAEVSAYVTKLEGSGFSVVDEEFVRCDTPDLTLPQGTVLLAKNLPTPEPAEGEDPEEGQEPEEEPTPAPDMVLTMRLTWFEDTCVVVGDQAEGRVTSPPTPPGGSGGSGGVTISGAMSYIRGLNPASLGLEGESMEDYNIYVLDGSALVDGQPCMRIAVYDSNNPEQSNDIVAYLLLAGDGTTVYKVDTGTGKAMKVDLP